MRRAGVLLHPSSLPGPYGMGDLGPQAREFLVWLEAAGQRIWQVLPLNPVDEHGCPYASASATARDPLYLSVDDLIADGWLQAHEKPYAGNPWRVDWAAMRAARMPLLRRAAERVRRAIDLEAWAKDRPWAADYALFQAIAEVEGPHWTRWPERLRDRDPAELDAVRAGFGASIGQHLALQWLFELQWARLREAAHRRGIALWGDLPFFVGGESADVWAHRSLFRLDDRGRPTVVTGVPPDAFSPEGQRWGHPMYDEAAHAATGHAWWVERAQAALSLVDTLRIDHFRGVESVWEIPAEAPSAAGGRWIPGPGAPLLKALAAASAGRDMPLLAEDLGIITPEVEALRDTFQLPGMAVLQFAFDIDPAHGLWGHPYLPHRHRPNQVVYTGTHDNDTTLGWYRSATDLTRDRVRRYLSLRDDQLPWGLSLAAWRSVADTAILPMQDLLGMGSDARMNAPGTLEGNWAWRIPPDALRLDLASWVAEQVRVSGR